MKILKRSLLGLLAILLIAVAWFLITNSRHGVATPDYQVERAENGFELRRYEELQLVSTSMKGKDMDGSFMRLFGYITGANDQKQNIAMTTPVIMARETDTASMSFIVPASSPTPSGAGVSLAKWPGGRVAALRFDGDQSKESAAKQSLAKWIAEQGLKAQGEAIAAYYDPPWTPQLLRRNEVLQRVE